MAHSLNFNNVDLSNYGVVVTMLELPVTQDSDYTQLPDKAYAWRSSLEPKSINVSIFVLAPDSATLKSYLDGIKLALNERESKQLKFDMYDDRYWLARFGSMQGQHIGQTAWQGELEFTCHDPVAYSTSEESNDYDIDVDPKTVQESASGTAIAYPVYTLTTDIGIDPATIEITSINTGYELIWEGSLSENDELEIDTVHWIIKLNDTESMENVSGKFPLLLPNTINHLKISGFSGTLNITYRNRYL